MSDKMSQGARDANAESHRMAVRSDQEAIAALLESILNEVRKQSKLLDKLLAPSNGDRA